MDLVVAADNPMLNQLALATGALILLVNIGASIGLSRLWKPGRPLFLVATAVMVVWTLFIEVPASPGWLAACESVFHINTGLVIALIYWTPLNQWFARADSLTDAPGNGSS